MDDRYYFSDWGGCTCSCDDPDYECPFADEHEIEEEEED